MKRVILDALPLRVRSAGIATYLEELVRAMARIRPETEFALFGPRPLPPDERSQASWPENVRRVDSLRYPLVMGHPFAGLRRLAALESVLGPADLFHGVTYAVPLTRFVPLVVTVHDLALIRFPELGTRSLRRMVRRTGRLAAACRRVIAVSESTRRDLVELCHVPEEKLRVVYNGNDDRCRPLPVSTARQQVRERYGLGDPYLLHVGTLEPRKNLDTLIRAYDRLRRQHGLRHRLVLVGPRGWAYAGLFRLVESLGLGERVCFTGQVPRADLPALYSAADLFVYPSLYEGFGLPVVEAMACGTPVVASAVSSLPEVVGDAGLLIDPRDEAALAEAMARALAQPALRDELRRRGFDRARLFSWERCARETLAVYDEVGGEN